MDHTATPRIYKPDSPHNASDQSTTGFSAVSETLIKNNSTSADNKNPSSQHVTECLIHGPDDGIETSVSEEPHGHKTCREQLFSYSVLTFTIATAVCMFAQLSLSVFTVTQVTSLEREYGFTTWQSGQLLSAAEIGFMCVAIPASYLASRVHVPRALSLACFLVGVAGIMCGLPHFLFPAETTYTNSTSLQSAVNIPPAFCVTGNTTPDTDRCPLDSEHSLKPPEDLVYNTQSYSVFIYIMMFQVFRGVVGAPRFAMFAVYIEQNADKTDTGYYMGILAAVTMLGPAIAFIVGGAISKLHVSLAPTDLNPDHPDWVGAWWLGFLVFGALAAFTPIAVVTFPRLLPNASPRKVTWNRRPAKGKGIWRDALTEAKLFGASLLDIMTNPVFILVVAAGCCLGFAMNGTYRFMPKYLQEQFNIPAWKANFIMGGAEFLVGTTGFFLGGWLTRRLKLTLQSLFKLVIALLTLAVLLMVVLMMIGCPQPQLVGTPGLNTSGDMAFSHCLSACACPDEVHPVCVDGVTYFSPCHAGCLAEIDGVYVNCSCTMSGRATAGLCDTDCVSVYPFTVIFYLLLFLLSVTGAPMYLLLVRSVADYQTGLAIGINGFSSSIVGYLIGPLVFGGLIDTCCEHWKSPCGATGACAVYNLKQFRLQTHLYSIVSTSMSLASYVMAFLLLTFCKRWTFLKEEQLTPQNYEEQLTPQNYEEQLTPQNYEEQLTPQNYEEQLTPQNYVAQDRETTNETL